MTHSHRKIQINKVQPELLKKILKDRKIRIGVTRQCLFFFLYVYFGKYLNYPMAPFHSEMFRIAEDEAIRRAVVVAFRNSAKSTILNTANALWSVVGIPQKKHVVIASGTQAQAQLHLKNIRMEVEENELLRNHLGPFREGEDEWRSSVLIIPRYEARITAVSIEEGIRGLRYGPYRPDLFIVDDIENSLSVRTKESRDKTFNWLAQELFPSGTHDVKAVLMGNILHLDSALMRLAELI